MNVGDLVDAGYAEIKTGPFGTQLRASDYVESGRAVLNVRNVGFGDVRPKDLEYVNEETAARLATHLLQVDDIVFGRKGAVERHAFINARYDGAMQGSDCIRLRVAPDSPMPARFITFALRTQQHQAWMQSFCSHGATMASLNQDIVRQIPLPEIDTDHQELAVAVLQNIDDLIENNRRRVAVLEETARTIYREWFVKPRYPGHEDVPLVDSALGPIPEGWSTGIIDDIVTVSKASVDPATLDPETPAVGLEHIPRQQITLDDWGKAGSQGSRKAVFEKGDVLFGKIRPYFHKVSVAPVDGICSTDAIVIRPHAAHWGQAVFVASSAEFVAYATQTSNGTKMPRADWKVLGKWPLAIPPTQIAESFSDVARHHLTLTETLMFENRRLAAMRDLLLPKLVTGQIDVSALDLDALVAEGVGS